MYIIFVPKKIILIINLFKYFSIFFAFDILIIDTKYYEVDLTT